MRVNAFAQDNIKIGEVPLVDFKDFQSWLDIGTGNGCVAQEWRHHSERMPKKVAVDNGEYPECLAGYGLFEGLDDKWEIYKEPYNESSKVWNDSFDFITIMDTIQYYYKPDGDIVLDNLIKKTNKLLIVWTTDGYYPDNGFSSCWHEEDFKKRGMQTMIAKGFHLGPPYVGDGLLSWYEEL